MLFEPKREKSFFHRLNLIGQIDELSLENAKEILKYVISKKALDIIYNPDKIKEAQAFYYPYLNAFKEVYDSDGSKRAYVKTMCEELRQKFEERLLNNTWMSNSSKNNAIKKLNAIIFYPGYTDTIPEAFLLEDNYDDCTSFIDFCERIATKTDLTIIQDIFNPDISLEDKLYEEITMLMNPITVNAFYAPSINIVDILITCLTGDFCNIDYPDAYNYGAIGMVVGHELCHAFDDNGSKYDEKGRTRDWWAVSDKLRYEEKKEQMKTLFNMFTLDSDSRVNINGEQTLGENLADYGGLTTSYDLFVSKKIKEGFSGEELLNQKRMFFESYSILWLGNLSDDFLKWIVENDEHTPEPFRVNGTVCEFDDWYDLYDVQPGDKYYLTPAQRIILW